jgi:hypothetical protein
MNIYKYLLIYCFIMNKKPPDKYKTIKISFKKIIRDSNSKDELFKIITKINDLVIHVYQFLRLWILRKYTKNSNIPFITKDLISMCFKVLILDSCGPKPKGQNQEIFSEFKNFYTNVYSKLGYGKKIDGKNLSGIINYLETDMLTNIENNIKQHFIAYLHRFINSYFHKQLDEQINSLNKKQKIERTKLLNQELKILKSDLINNTKKCDEKYYSWINKYSPLIKPDLINKSLLADIHEEPQKYLKYMIFINLEIEKLGFKQFQFFPLRTELTPKYCPLDTKSLIDILIKKNKNHYLSNIMELKEEIWRKFFKLDHSIFKMKNYQFNHFISTDCFSVSIQFIYKSYIEKENQLKKQMKETRNKARLANRNLTEKQKDDLKMKKKQEKKQLQSEKRKKYLEQKKLQGKTQPKEKYVEFPYLEELNEEKIKELKESNKVYIDPGKKLLLMMIDDKGNTLKYSNKQRMFETKRLKYLKLRECYKKREKIKIYENLLSNFNSKTCNYNKFKYYIKYKNKINEILKGSYQNEFFRKYQWYSYINTKRSEDGLVNRIKNTFGTNIKIIMGDWSIGKQLRNFISTPMISLKRKLHESFEIYNLDEFRTSKLHYKTELECSNLYLPDSNNIPKKIHSVLTYQMGNNRYGCIQRDMNSVKNMKKITDHWFRTKERPLRYQRTYDLSTNNTIDSNPKSKVSNRIKPEVRL